MENYIGVKRIKAIPINRLDYNTYRGWELPADENGSDEGFLVEYIDGGQSNHPAHSGYVSWSPKDVFEKAYRKTEGLTFGEAIEALRQGELIARNGWNGKGMFICKQIPAVINAEIIPKMTSLPQSAKNVFAKRGEQSISYANQMLIVNSDNRADSWVPSSSDCFAEDWIILE